jgi:Flp pilus assembly protein TadG
MERKNTAIVRRGGRGFLGVDGAAAVELAMTAPILVVLLLGIADYGLLMGDSAALEGATRAGAEVGKANPSVTGAQLTALNLFPAGIAPPSVTSVCTCVDNTWPNGAVCPPPLIGVNACAAANGGNGITNPYTNQTDNRVLQYVKVSATQSVSPIVSYGTFTAAKSLNPQTTIRYQ